MHFRLFTELHLAIPCFKPSLWFKGMKNVTAEPEMYMTVLRAAHLRLRAVQVRDDCPLVRSCRSPRRRKDEDIGYRSATHALILQLQKITKDQSERDCDLSAE